jgi:hypothetical protein
VTTRRCQKSQKHEKKQLIFIMYYQITPILSCHFFLCDFLHMSMVPETKKMCCLETGMLPRRLRNHGRNRLVLPPTWLDCHATCVNCFLTLRLLAGHIFLKKNCYQFRHCSSVPLFCTVLITIKNQCYNYNLRLITIIIGGPPYHLLWVPSQDLVCRVLLSLHIQTIVHQ